MNLFVLLSSCSHSAPTTSTPTPRPTGATDRILPLLPDGAQVVIELDLARLRGNAVVGAVATRALDHMGAETHMPGLPFVVQGSPIAGADAVVLAAYGVGTEQAATAMILATHNDVPGGTRLTPDFVAIGPEDLVGQLQARAALDAKSPLVAPHDLLALREHAMPKGATGAVLRVTARLSFDARVALARQTGLEVAPARLSLWSDIADDLAIVIDADAVDPGDPAAKDAAHRLGHAMRLALVSMADDPLIRGLGIPNSVADARLIAQGTWVRAIIAVGPRHLARAVERANAMLQGAAS